MRVHSFIPPSALLEKAKSVTLPAAESHHLAQVLRVKPGQPLSLFDGEGTRVQAVIESVSKRAVTAHIRTRESIPPPPVSITLIQALPKADRFEMVLQKATELGVFRICPAISTHTVNRPKDAAKAMTRWQTILQNAGQQCGTAWLPKLDAPCPFESLLDSLPAFDLAAIGSLHSGAQPLKQILREASSSPHRSVALLIGPEGDFTTEEIDRAVKRGARPATFCPQILRTETAALFGISALVYEFIQGSGAETKA